MCYYVHVINYIHDTHCCNGNVFLVKLLSGNFFLPKYIYIYLVSAVIIGFVKKFHKYHLKLTYDNLSNFCLLALKKHLILIKRYKRVFFQEYFHYCMIAILGRYSQRWRVRSGCA